MQLRFAAALLAFVLLSVGARTPAQEAAQSASAVGIHSLDKPDLDAWLDGLLPYALKSGDIAGGVIAVVKDGKVLVQRGFGYADVARQRPMDPERTMIRAGSTSKLFTWTAVMQLVEQGKIDLNRNVDEYLDFKVSPPGRHAHHHAGFDEPSGRF